MGAGVEILNSDAIHIREQAKINAARITQKARNELKAATAAQNTWVQSFSNQRRLKAAGNQLNELTENIGRNLDAATYGRVGERLAASEELGANIAAAAAAGVGGSVVETYNNTIQLNAAMNEEQGDRALRTDLLASSAMRGDIISSAVGSMDNESFQAGLDYTQFVDHQKLTTFQKVAGIAGAAAATYFAGPDAGNAVLSFVSAQNRAANGDFEGAAMRGVDVLKGAITGAKTYSDAGGESYGGKLWDSVKQRYGPRLGI